MTAWPLVLAAVTFAAAFTQTTQTTQTTKSVWNGVYTSEQAARGTELYRGKCAECHGDDLEAGKARRHWRAGRSDSVGMARR